MTVIHISVLDKAVKNNKKHNGFQFLNFECTQRKIGRCKLYNYNGFILAVNGQLSIQKCSLWCPVPKS